MIRKTSIVKNFFVGEFLRIVLRLGLLWQTTLSEWNTMLNCVKEIITKKTFDLQLKICYYKNNRDIVKIIQKYLMLLSLFLIGCRFLTYTLIEDVFAAILLNFHVRYCCHFTIKTYITPKIVLQILKLQLKKFCCKNGDSFQWLPGINLTHRRRSKDVHDVLWTSQVGPF